MKSEKNKEFNAGDTVTYISDRLGGLSADIIDIVDDDVHLRWHGSGDNVVLAMSFVKENFVVGPSDSDEAKLARVKALILAKTNKIKEHEIQVIRYKQELNDIKRKHKDIIEQYPEDFI